MSSYTEYPPDIPSWVANLQSNVSIANFEYYANLIHTSSNISLLNNDSGYLTSIPANLLHISSNISLLTNDAAFIKTDTNASLTSLTIPPNGSLSFLDTHHAISYSGASGNTYFAGAYPSEGVAVAGWADGCLGTTWPGTGGKIALYWDLNGQVGIGTTAPAFSLDVNGSARILSNSSQALRLDAPAGNNALSIGGTGIISIDAPFIPGGRLVLLDNGCLGLNKTNPLFPLDVQGTIRANVLSLPNANVFTGNTSQLQNDYGFITAANVIFQSNLNTAMANVVYNANLNSALSNVVYNSNLTNALSNVAYKSNIANVVFQSNLNNALANVLYYGNLSNISVFTLANTNTLVQTGGNVTFKSVTTSIANINTLLANNSIITTLNASNITSVFGDIFDLRSNIVETDSLIVHSGEIMLGNVLMTSHPAGSHGLSAFEIGSMIFDGASLAYDIGTGVKSLFDSAGKLASGISDPLKEDLAANLAQEISNANSSTRIDYIYGIRRAPAGLTGMANDVGFNHDVHMQSKIVYDPNNIGMDLNGCTTLSSTGYSKVVLDVAAQTAYLNTLTSGSVVTSNIASNSGSLAIASSVSIQGNVSANNITVSGTLNASNILLANVPVVSSQWVSGNTLSYSAKSISVEKDIYGNAGLTIQGVLRANATAVVANNMSVYGNFLANSLSVSYDTMMYGNITVEGNLYATTGNIAGNLFCKSLYVNNVVYQASQWIQGNTGITYGSNVFVSKDFYIGGNIYNTSANTELVIDSDVCIVGNLRIDPATLIIEGNLVLWDSIQCNGGFHANGQALLSGNVNIVGQTSIIGNLLIQSDILLQGNILASDGSMWIKGDTTFLGNLVVGNIATHAPLGVSGSNIAPLCDLYMTTPTSGNILNDPITVLQMTRCGTNNQSCNAIAQFALSRSSNSSTNAMTRLDLMMSTNSNNNTSSVLTVLGKSTNTCCLGINTTTPIYALDVNGSIRGNVMILPNAMAFTGNTSQLYNDAGFLTAVGTGYVSNNVGYNINAGTVMTTIFQPPGGNQCASLGWNRSGTGAAVFACQQGGGSGGFEWVQYNSLGNLVSVPMSLSGGGLLNCTQVVANVIQLPNATAFTGKTSQLNNDAGFLTAVGTGYVANNIGYNLKLASVTLPNTSSFTGKVSELNNDSGFITSLSGAVLPSTAASLTSVTLGSGLAIDIATTSQSYIGWGTNYLGYAFTGGQFFNDASAGDLVIRSTSNNILLGSFNAYYNYILGVLSNSYASVSTRLGICTKTPAYPLDVYGSGNASPVCELFLSSPATSATALNDPMPVLQLVRNGTSGQSWNAIAQFALSRSVNSGVNAMTRLDLMLSTNNNATTSSVLTVLGQSTNSCFFGVNTQTPTATLDVNGTFYSHGNGKINNFYLGDLGFGSGFTGFCHTSLNGNQNNYALLQSAGGYTYLGCASAMCIYIGSNNSYFGNWSTTGLTVGSGNAAAYTLDVGGTFRVLSAGAQILCASNGALQISSTSSTLPITITSNIAIISNVVNNGSHYLQVNGITNVQVSQYNFVLTQSAGIFYNTGSTQLQGQVVCNGLVGIGTSSPSYSLDVASTARLSGNVYLATNSTGNVGVGTTSPLYKLDVSGTARVSGNLVATNLSVGNNTAGTMTNFLSGGLSLSGSTGSISGGHIQAYTTADSYPIFQMLNWQHDNICLGFDSYYDGSNFVSGSSTAASYEIYKLSGQLCINYAPAANVGTAISRTTPLCVNKNQVILGGTGGGAYQFSVNGFPLQDSLIYAATNGAATPTFVVQGASVGIGVAVPSYPLHVVGTRAGTVNGYYFGSGSGVVSGFGSSSQPISIFSTGAICTQTNFLAYSDGRVKKDVVLRDGVADLDTLCKIPVKSFKYIDGLHHSEDEYVGVIAQDLEKIEGLQNSVKEHPDFLPSYYELRKIHEIDDTSFSVDGTFNEATGIALKFYYMRDGVETPVEGCVCDGNIISHNEGLLGVDQIFLYGIKDNVKSVNYNSLYTIGLSATQELARIVKEQQSLIEGLQRELKDMRKYSYIHNV